MRPGYWRPVTGCSAPDHSDRTNWSTCAHLADKVEYGYAEGPIFQRDTDKECTNGEKHYCPVPMAPRSGVWEWTANDCDIPVIDSAALHRCGKIKIHTWAGQSNLLKKELKVRYGMEHPHNLGDEEIPKLHEQNPGENLVIIVEAFALLGIEAGFAKSEDEVRHLIEKMMHIGESASPRVKLVYVLAAPTHEFEWPRIANPRLKTYNEIAVNVIKQMDKNQRWSVVDVWSPLLAMPTSRGTRAVGFAEHAGGIEFNAYISQILSTVCTARTPPSFS